MMYLPPCPQMAGPGKSCGASPNFWQGSALLALMLAQRGGVFTTKKQWQRFQLASAGVGLLP